MKTLLRHFRGDWLVVLIFFGAFTFSALAQTVPTPVKQVPAGSMATIGHGATPASTNTPQGKMLGSALSPETRQTLQAAMDSTSK